MSFRLLLSTVAGLLLGAAHANAQTPTCVPSFPYQQGWYGADSAASIPLSEPGETPARTLWLFGDSFVNAQGNESLTNRWDTDFLNNTVAKGACDENGAWSIDYQWDDSAGGAEAVFLFDPDDPRGRIFYWPLAGVKIDGAVYAILVAVRNNTKNTRFDRIDARLRKRFADADAARYEQVRRRAFHRAAWRLGGDRVVGITPSLEEDDDPFTLLGTAIARVSNPTAHARDWQIDYREVSRDRRFFPAGAAVVSDGFLYLLGWRQPEGDPKIGRQFLARIPLGVVSSFPIDLTDRVEVLGQSGWGGPNTPPRILMTGTLATEMGLQKLPDDCGWLVSQKAAFEPVTDATSDRILIRTAPSLEGPWSSERLVGRVTETSPDSVSGETPAAICYAAKVHPWLSAPDRLLYTYICNTYLSPVPFDLWNKMDLYVPRSVSVSLPTPGNADDLADECPWLVRD